MDNENRESFALYRLEKAKETLKSAKILFEEVKDYTSANNRAYYAIFYANRAVLALEEIDFKRHKDVIAYFNQKYIKPEIFPRKLGSKIAQAQRVREDSDYDDKYQISYEKTEQQINTAEDVIAEVEKYIQNQSGEKQN